MRRAPLFVLCLFIALAACAPAASAPSPSAPGATVGPSVAPSPAASGTVGEIDRLRAKVAADSTDAAAWRDLGLAFSQRVRETADPSLYASAEAAFEQARALTPGDPLLLVGIGGLLLGRHQFADALETGRRAVALDAALAPAHAVVFDALVELGRYDEAKAALDDLLALSINLTSLARFSYWNELHGDLVKAEASMSGARSLPGLAPENVAYVTALHGNLLVWLGQPEEARAEYRAALALVPLHAPSIAGLARLNLADGNFSGAVSGFELAESILPLPEYVIALGEAQEALGDAAAAAESYELARAEISLFEAAGVTVDLELALFEANHGDANRALGLATAAYAETPTVRAADALAWALHKLGRDAEAREQMDEALRLGSVDPLFRYHSGMIWASLGSVEQARTDLTAALATDAGFSATAAQDARTRLEALGG